MDERIQRLIRSGREHYHSGDLAQAEEFLAEAADAQPTLPDVFNMLGVIYYQSGRFAEAEQALETALSLNPGYTEAALNLAVTYNDRGKYDQARDVYNRVVSASYSQPRAIDRFARGKLANMHADLGAAYAGLGLGEDAVREYRTALSLCPDFVDLQVRLGNVYRDMGNHGAAREVLTAATQASPTYQPARLELGVVLYSLGRRDEAKAQWQEVLRVEPENKRASMYLKMIGGDHPPAPGSALGGGDAKLC